MSRFSPQPNVITAVDCGFSRLFWPALVLSGIATGLAAGLLMKLLRLTQHWSFGYASGTFLDGATEAGWERRLLVVAGAGVLAGLAGWLLKRGPGGHAGELTVQLWFHAGRLSPFLVTARSILSIVLVGLGASLGREAAPKQMGALLASLAGLRAGLTPPERRLLVACGAGAGMAAVYNVPLGGALFALEVLLGTLSLPLVVPALLMSVLATAASWSLLPMQSTYSLPDHVSTAGLVVWSLLAGPLAGLASVAYTRGICWADSRRPKGWQSLLAPVLAFAALAGLGVPLPQLLGNGKDVVQLVFLDRMGAGLLLALLVLKPLVTAACLGSGAPGGLFTPTLAFGALFGGLFGRLWALLWPGVAPGATALVGAGAVLAGTTLGPISSIVLILELTHSADALLVPLMLATGGAVLTARALDPRSIYSGRVHLGQIEAGRAGQRQGAGWAATLPSAARAAELLERMLRARAEARYAVVDERGALVGAVESGGAAGAAEASLFGATAAIVTVADLARAAREAGRQP